MQQAKNRDNIEINKLHMAYMDAMCDLWPYIRQRAKASDSNDTEGVERATEQMRSIIDRAADIQQQTTKYRIIVMQLYQENEEFARKEDELCSEDFIRWINYYAWTFDPRLSAMGLPAHIPFVLWPKQEEFLMFIEEQYRNKRKWVADKSRAVGLTWCFSAWCVHHWIYRSGFVAGLGSRKEEMVDRMGDPSTLFHKIRYLIDNLPPRMRPQGFDDARRTCDNTMRIVNPYNGSSIIGEGGDNIGAGGRTSVYIVDEKALVERQGLVDQSLSLNTDCQGDVSTPRGMNEFGKKVDSGKLPLFRMWWYYNPMLNHEWRTGKRPKENEWYKWQCEQLDDVTRAQEVDIDYHASVEGVFIPSDWVLSTVDFDIEEDGQNVAGFDVSGSGKNESAYVKRVGPVVYPTVLFPYKTSVEATMAAVRQAEEDDIEVLCYDEGGIGNSILGLFKTGQVDITFRHEGIIGESAASDAWMEGEGKRAFEKFGNRRAELWWAVRERCRKTYEHRNDIHYYASDEMLSIPSGCIKLIQQMSAPLMKMGRNGKILVESKKEMKARGIESPDEGDALAYSFAVETMTSVVNKFDYRSSSNQFTDFPVRFDNPVTMHYVSIVQSKDMLTSVLCCVWTPSPRRPLLQVYEECSIQNAQPKEIVDWVNSVMEPDRKPIKEWIANEEMFEGEDDGTVSPWYIYRRAGVKLHENYTNGFDGSLMLLNQMFERGCIQIHTSCDQLFHHMREWTRVKSTVKEPHGLVMALCQLLSRLRVKKQITDRMFIGEPYRREKRFTRTAKGVYPDVGKEFAKRSTLYTKKYGYHRARR